jgi:hypothetical protein
MMMRPRSGLLPLTLLALLACAAPSLAAPIPSKAAAAPAALPAAGPSQSPRATVEALLARDEVAQALAARGFSAEQVEHRVAQLSEQDIAALADNLDRVQAAGNVPEYIWILLGILLAVTILATVF